MILTGPSETRTLLCMMTTRDLILEQLADTICAVERPHTLRVGIDGLPASGKTTLADELVAPINARGRTVIRATGDGFHNPRPVRYQQGKGSPKGYYDDSFNHGALKECLLFPLGPGGNGQFRRARFNFRIDEEVDAPIEQARQSDILLLDGLFLHKATLRDHWDLTLFVDADFDVVTDRAATRDIAHFDDEQAVRDTFTQRFLPGHQLYFDIDTPKKRASIRIDNNDPGSPVVYDQRSATLGR